MKPMIKKTAAKKTTRRPGIATAKPVPKKAEKPTAPLLGEHPVPAAKTERPKAAVPAAKPERLTRAGLAYRLIKEGKTNAEVWEALKAAFDMPAHHAYYPGWYRSHLVVEGAITKAFASEHRGEPVRRTAPAAVPAPAPAPVPAPASKPAAKKAAK